MVKAADVEFSQFTFRPTGDDGADALVDRVFWLGVGDIGGDMELVLTKLEQICQILQQCSFEPVTWDAIGDSQLIPALLRQPLRDPTAPRTSLTMNCLAQVFDGSPPGDLSRITESCTLHDLTQFLLESRDLFVAELRAPYLICLSRLIRLYHSRLGAVLSRITDLALLARDEDDAIYTMDAVGHLIFDYFHKFSTTDGRVIDPPVCFFGSYMSWATSEVCTELPPEALRLLFKVLSTMAHYYPEFCDAMYSYPFRVVDSSLETMDVEIRGVCQRLLFKSVVRLVKPDAKTFEWARPMYTLLLAQTVRMKASPP